MQSKSAVRRVDAVFKLQFLSSANNLAFGEVGEFLIFSVCGVFGFGSGAGERLSVCPEFR